MTYGLFWWNLRNDIYDNMACVIFLSYVFFLFSWAVYFFVFLASFIYNCGIIISITRLYIDTEYAKKIIVNVRLHLKNYHKLGNASFEQRNESDNKIKAKKAIHQIWIMTMSVLESTWSRSICLWSISSKRFQCIQLTSDIILIDTTLSSLHCATRFIFLPFVEPADHASVTPRLSM